MDGELFRRARPVFETAIELPVDEREAYVAREAADDPELDRAVRRLLTAHADDSFLGGVDHAALEPLIGGEPVARGEPVGPYRLLELIGMGGMGAVYLAERADGEFDQRVAIKLMRAGPLGPEALERFRRERQILAWLDHPNIARLLDGGMAVAGPYLVMEHVAGVPIDRYADQRRLDLAQRIRLFLSVVGAVDHAHRNLVVHRDLKPGNILVTDAGQVKLLDFGIARLTEDDGHGTLTAAGQRAFTPAYASPEQLRGEPLGTASDVYSLGAVLYRLLTGRLPHQSEGLSPAAFERLVSTEPPARASSHRGELAGDLDMILQQALHAEPARRYRSAAELGDDLERHLERRPVKARPDTVGYRVSRFVRRNTVTVVATGLIALAVVAGVVATTIEGRRAERRFEEVRRLANALLFDLHDAVRDLPGATAVRRMLVSRALEYLDVLRREAPSDRALELELAAAYEQVGEIQGDPHRANLGDLEGALASYRQAFELRNAVWRRDTTDRSVRRALGNSYGRLAVVTSWNGDNGRAIELSRAGLELLAPLGDGSPDARGDYGRVQSELGWWLVWAGRVEDGLALLDSALTQLEPLASGDSASTNARLNLWLAYSYRVDGLRFSSRHPEALTLLEQRARPVLDRLADRRPRDPTVQYAFHVYYDFLTEMHLALGELARAATAARTSLAFAEQMVESDSANQKAFEGLARGYGTLGDVLIRSDALDEAIPPYRQAIEVYEALYRRNQQNHEIGNMLGNAERRLCRVLSEAGRQADAMSWCLAGERVLEQVVEANAANAVVRANLGSAYVTSARVLAALSRRSPGDSATRLATAAVGRYRDGIRLLREIEGTDATPELYADSVAAELRAFESRR
ncbi:MAG: serine/threonine protein kinase [Gemmatimonadales bacterium]